MNKKLEDLLDSYHEFVKSEEWDCVMLLKKKTHDQVVISSQGDLNNIIPVFTVSEFVNTENKEQENDIGHIRAFILNAAANILVDNQEDRMVFMAGIQGAINTDKTLN